MLKKRPAAALAWLWAILFIPFLGALAYVGIGTDRLTRRRLKRRVRMPARAERHKAPESITDPATAALLAEIPRRDRQFLRLLSRLNDVPLSSAESIRILRNAEEFYPALEDRFEQAKHHIHVELYIWQRDETGRRFLAALTRAARRGVIVRLLLDRIGSSGISSSFLREFLRAGGKFSWFQSMDLKRRRFFPNLRNHRKLQIIDGRTAFVGGMNIGREYEGSDGGIGRWFDVQAEVTGPVSSELQEVFADDWYFATDERIEAAVYYPTDFPRPRHPVAAVVGGPDRRSGPMGKSIVSLLNNATERAWIATGYFVPDEILLTALEITASRGVDVRLLVSEKNDHPILITIGRSFYGELLAAGVRIFEFSTCINHAKIAVVDGAWGMVGSANLDHRSMRLNFELNVAFNSPEHTAILARILEEDFSKCHEIDPAVFHRRPAARKLLEASLRPLSPLL